VTTSTRSVRPVIITRTMTLIIRRAEPSAWEAYRSIRLRSLFEEPDAYEAAYENEATLSPTGGDSD
jgi:hypothetical protein